MLDIVYAGNHTYVYVDIERTFDRLKVGDVLVDIFYFLNSLEKIKMYCNTHPAIPDARDEFKSDVIIVTAIERREQCFYVMSVRYPDKILVLKRSLCRYALLDDIMKLMPA